jgi:DNA-directed RNA polymerase specialized sigma24 family protein
VTNRPTYISDEELIKQLQSLLRATPPAGSPQPPTREQVEETRSLAAEFAERIYGDPDKWGLTAIPGAFRDDAAGDALVALFYAAPDMRGRQSVAEWFTGTVESKFRRIWAVAERQNSERALRAREASSTPPEPEPVPAAEEADAAQSLFEDESSIWPGFEDSFPRDAFALRLRYHLKRDSAEMAVMLDAPSARAITMRVDRARDRFRMYCEQQGVNRRDLTDLVAQVSEETEA